jgi:GntR family transcriptional regulator, rspAB operon transcriptional repressor
LTLGEGPSLQQHSAEAVHQRLRDAILDAELPPGHTMSQVTLAEQLGVSRTPLREALRQLQAEGLIEAHANRQVRVSPVSVEDVEDLSALRLTTEATALRLSVSRLTPEDIGAIHGFLAEMDHYSETGDYRRWCVPHAAFHAQLTAHAGRRFEVLLGQLFDHCERYRRLHIGHAPAPWGAGDHQRIFEAVKAGDADLSASRLAHHVARTGRDVIELIAPGYEPTRLEQALEQASRGAGD